MIDVSTRLRRAIHLHDLLLLKRILTSHPKHLRNPDFTDKSNTLLHIAAKLGVTDAVEYLILSGHEDEGISKNADWDTPLILACEAGHEDAVRLLMRRFWRCVLWKNKMGFDALMAAAHNGNASICELLLTYPNVLDLELYHEDDPDANGITTSTPSLPYLLLQQQPETANPNTQDGLGNTPLHHAAAYGHLKVIRTLVDRGANPAIRNHYSWTAVSYSVSVQAEVYFKTLIAEGTQAERPGTAGSMDQITTLNQRANSPVTAGRVVREHGRRDAAPAGMGGGAGGGVRLVQDDEEARPPQPTQAPPPPPPPKDTPYESRDRLPGAVSPESVTSSSGAPYLPPLPHHSPPSMPAVNAETRARTPESGRVWVGLPTRDWDWNGAGSSRTASNTPPGGRRSTE